MFLTSCNNTKEEKITNPADYNIYLNTSINNTFDNANSEKEFWTKRLRKDSTGIGELRPLANAYATMYEASGDTLYLKNAEMLYRKAITISAHNKNTYLLDLAKNLLSQHRYKEAKSVLEQNLKGSSNRRASQLTLFDITMKLKNYSEADKILATLENASDYNYLIRLAERNKHHKNYEVAIKNMKAAMKVSEERKNKKMQITTNLQLAELYLLSEKNKEAYKLYIKILQLQADNVLAKKQLAWIVFKIENNPKEANRIMDSVLVNYKSPDYLLFKSEISLSLQKLT